MAQGDIGLRVHIDAGQAKGEAEAFSRSIADLNQQLKDTAQPKDWQSIAQLAQKVNEASSARSQVMEMARQTQTQGGLTGQSFNIDTSQSIRDIGELSSAILSLKQHWEAAKTALNDQSVSPIEESIKYLSSARLDAVEHFEVRKPPAAEGIIRQAEETNENKATAQILINKETSRRPETVPLIPQTNQIPQPNPLNPQTNQALQYLQNLQSPLKNGNINQRVNIDASQAKTQIEDLERLVEGLINKIKELNDNGDTKGAAQLYHALENATSARGNLMAQARQVESQQARENMKGGGNSGGGAGLADVGKYLMAHSLTKLTETVVSALEKGFEAAKQRASGNYTGAAVTEMQRNASLISGGAGLAAGIAGFILGGPLGAGIAGLLTEKIVGYFAGKPAHEMQENLAYSAQYKNAMPGIDSLNQLYGGAINRKSAEQNNAYGMEMRGRAVEAARGTGLETDRFIEAMGKMAAYGDLSFNTAANMTRTQALWSRFTGADLGTIQKFAGQAYRYAGETDAVSLAYGGLKAQDMGKGQFSEFLNSLERVMSEGIAKGFVKSTEEIAGNMQMLYKLSGGSALWQGEQGAQRLSQMNNAIANATNLESVEDVISFGAARDLLMGDNPLADFDEREARFKELTKGPSTVTVTDDANFRSSASGGDNIMGTVRAGRKVDVLEKEGDYYKVNNNGVEGYIHKTLLDMKNYKESSGNVYTGTYVDVMQLLERGVSADLLKGQWSAVRQLSDNGENRAAMIEHFMKMYGLNYTGGAQVWNMTREAWDEETGDWKKSFNSEEFAAQINKMRETVGFQSDSVTYQNMINALNQLSVKIGQIEFKKELDLLKAAMKELEDALRKRIEPEPKPPDPRAELPVDLPKRDDSRAGIRAQMADGRILQALLTAPPTNEGRYKALSGIVTSGLTDANAGRIPEYWKHRATLARAMGEGPEGKGILTSDELKELIPDLKSLAEANKKGDLFTGKSDEEIHNWLIGDMGKDEETSPSGAESGNNRETGRIISKLDATMDRLETRLNTPLDIHVLVEYAS
jgi:uncharacterized protein YgiM (DUF1202 family)